MANTFFKAQGYPIGDSLCEDEALDTARQLLKSGAIAPALTSGCGHW